MDEVKIWAIQDESMAVALKSKSQVDTEGLLEETLVANPELLIPGLRLVGRQMPTEGGPLDLLGVDEDGRLVVFELKRGTLSREAVAQIIDYASDLDLKSDDELAEHIADSSGAGGIEKIDDFEEWHGENTDAQSLGSLRPLRLFLVGLGADDRTERMVRFLADNSGMDISLLTFHGFEYDGKTLLARQVEVEAVAEPERRRTRRRRSRAELRENFDVQVSSYGVSDLLNAVQDMFRENWPASRQSVGALGLRVQLPEAYRRQYARIDAWEEGTVGVVFFTHTKALCLDEFREPVREIRYQTWPLDREPLEDPDTEIQFKLTTEEWETHKERLYTLTRAVYEAWESRDREEESS